MTDPSVHQAGARPSAEGQGRRSRHRRAALLRVGLLALILVLLNVLASGWPLRWDLTEGRRFTMAEPTRALLGDLDDIVGITVYLGNEGLTPNLARLREETLSLLRRFEEASGGNVVYQVLDPNAIEDRDNRLALFKELQDRGLLSVELRSGAQAGEGFEQRYLFPYAEVEYRGGDPEVVLLTDQFLPVVTPMWDPEAAVALLEYNLARAIRQVTVPVKPRVAFVTGHGELDSLSVLDLSYALREFYRVDRFDLNTVNAIDTGYAALILAGSRNAFSTVNKFKLDQYLLRGGSLLWFLDGVVANFDSLIAHRGEYFSQPTARGIGDLLFQYGARVNENLVQDRQNARIAVPLGESGQYEQRPWPYRPIVTNHHPAHPIGRNLDAVLMAFASTVDTVASPGVRKTILMRSSDNARALPDPVRVRFNLLVNPLPDEAWKESGLPLAVLLEGRFPSAFRTRAGLAERFTARGVGGDAFVATGVPARQIVVGDADFVRNAVAPDGRIAPLGLDQVEQYIFANKDWVLNALEYLTDNSGLMATRAKEVRLRPLDPVRVREGRSTWPLLAIVAPVLLLALLGLVYNVVRWRRYGMRPEA